MDGTDSTQMESREKVLGKLRGHRGEEIASLFTVLVGIRE